MEVGIDIGSLTAVAFGPFRRTHRIISNALAEQGVVLRNCPWP